MSTKRSISKIKNVGKSPDGRINAVELLTKLRALPAEIRGGLWLPWGYGVARKPGMKPPKIAARASSVFGEAIARIKRIGSNDPDSWTSVDDALDMLEQMLRQEVFSKGDQRWEWTPAGLARLCSSDPELWVIDLDNCVVHRKLSKASAEFVKRAAAYSEISPSGTGLRIAFEGARPPKLGRAEFGTIGDLKVESYDAASTRYVTFTGDSIGVASVVEPSAAFTKWFVANWKGSAAARSDSNIAPASMAVVDALTKIVNGNDRDVQIVPIRIDYTRAPDPSAEFAAAIREAAKQTNDLRVVLASAIILRVSSCEVTLSNHRSGTARRSDQAHRSHRPI